MFFPTAQPQLPPLTDTQANRIHGRRVRAPLHEAFFPMLLGAPSAEHTAFSTGGNTPEHGAPAGSSRFFRGAPCNGRRSAEHAGRAVSGTCKGAVSEANFQIRYGAGGVSCALASPLRQCWCCRRRRRRRRRRYLAHNESVRRIDKMAFITVAHVD